jgi:divalent metal cation (Fe/Co/Zn/Cd) transporter
VILRAGKRHHSITLEADAHHLTTDVWTSAGVLVSVGLVALTGWLILDPLTVFTHLEPLDDQCSWEDTELDRAKAPSARPEV